MDLVDLWFVICACTKCTVPSNGTIRDDDVYFHNQLSLYGKCENPMGNNNICNVLMKAFSLNTDSDWNLLFSALLSVENELLG